MEECASAGKISPQCSVQTRPLPCPQFSEDCERHRAASPAALTNVTFLPNRFLRFSGSFSNFILRNPLFIGSFQVRFVISMFLKLPIPLPFYTLSLSGRSHQWRDGLTSPPNLRFVPTSPPSPLSVSGEGKFPFCSPSPEKERGAGGEVKNFPF